ncbi:hypothetical protein D1872_340180 [compost metagenome]
MIPAFIGQTAVRHVKVVVACILVINDVRRFSGFAVTARNAFPEITVRIAAIRSRIDRLPCIRIDLKNVNPP